MSICKCLCLKLMSGLLIPGLLLPGIQRDANAQSSVPDKTVSEKQEVAEESLPNTNQLVKQYKDQLKFNASSAWSGWPVENAFDGDQQTSWFSEQNDSAALEKDPWLEVEFPEDITVCNINVWGNREPSWPTGYSVTRGKIILFNANGKELASLDAAGTGEKYDFEFWFGKTIPDVRRVRFVSLADQGNENPCSDTAIAEIEIE